MVEGQDALDALIDMGRELSAAFQQAHNTEARGQFVREIPPGIIPPSMFEREGRTRSTRHGRSQNPTPPTQLYVDWDWTRDALPVVEKYRSILTQFAARQFGLEFRDACRELRSKGLAAFGGFETFGATSHHELLARLIGLSLETIAQQKSDAMSTFEQAPHADQLSKLRTALLNEADSVREMRAKLPPLMCPRCNRERDFDDLKLGREYCPDCWQLDADQLAKSPSLVHTTWILKSLKQAEVEKDTNNVNWLKKKHAKFADTLLKIKVELRRIGRLELREDITIDYAENTLPEIIAELSMSQHRAGETLTIEQARGLRLTDVLTYLVNAPEARTKVSGSGPPSVGLTVSPHAERNGSISSSGLGEPETPPKAMNAEEDNESEHRTRESELLAYRDAAESANGVSQELLRSWRRWWPAISWKRDAVRPKDAFEAIQADLRKIEQLRQPIGLATIHAERLVKEAAASVRPLPIEVGQYTFDTAHEAAFRLADFVIKIWEESDAEILLEDGPRESNAYLMPGEHCDFALMSLRRLSRDAQRCSDNPAAGLDDDGDIGNDNSDRHRDLGSIPHDLYARIQHEFQAALNLLDKEFPPAPSRTTSTNKHRTLEEKRQYAAQLLKDLGITVLNEGAVPKAGSNEHAAVPEDYKLKDVWLTAERCEERFGLNAKSLSRWAMSVCPHLPNGKLLRRAKFPPLQKQFCYSLADILTIKERMPEKDE